MAPPAKRVRFSDQMDLSNCPLHPDNIPNIDWSDIKCVREIDNHLVKDNCCYDHPPPADYLLKQSDGCTLLLKACALGSVKVVKHIFERWGVDVNTSGVWQEPQLRIEGATPLFVALIARRYGIARYLIEKGADVNTSTSSGDHGYAGMTPLHAAVRCTVHHSSHCCDVRKYPELNVEALATILFLIEHGADPSAVTQDGTTTWLLAWHSAEVVNLLINAGMRLDQLSHFGETILQFWASYSCIDDSCSVIKLLMEKGVEMDVIDMHGLSPLNVVALGKHNKLNVEAFDSMINQPDIGRQQELEALELAVSTCLLDPNFGQSREAAVSYWRKAVEHRVKNGELLETLLKASPFKSHLKHAFRFPGEMMQALEDERALRAFTLRIEILGRISQEAVMHYCWPYIQKLMVSLPPSFSPRHLLLFCMAVLEAAFRFETFCEETSRVIVFVCHVIPGALKELRQRNKLTAEILERTLKLITDIDGHQSAQPCLVFENRPRGLPYKNAICETILVAATQPEKLTKQSKEYLKHLVSRDYRDYRRRTPLLMACERAQLCMLSVVELLLEVGAQPDAVDRCGNSALHYLAQNKAERVESNAACLLVEKGCRSDRVNQDGKTALEVLNCRCPWTRKCPPSWSLTKVVSYSVRSSPTTIYKLHLQLLKAK